MKKSEIYRMTQLVVLATGFLNDSDKLEIIRELMEKEDTALFCEKQESLEG